MPERSQFELDRDAKRRREVQFTPRDDVRDFARSGLGRNYFAIENLQAQAPTFTKDDPRIDELKQRRRTWNRSQKYPAGEILGKTPQQMQNEYMGLSRDLRQTAKPVYNRMYPITGGFMDYADKGGLWGSMLSQLAGKTLKKGRDYLDDLGVASLAADETEEDKERYITETFGPHRKNIDEYIEGPGESEVIYSPHADTYYDRAEGLDFEDDPDQPYVAPDDYVEEDFGDFYIDEDTLAPPYQEPFGDSAREQAIMEQNQYIPPVQEELGIPSPQGDFARFNEYPTPEIGVEFGGEEVPPALPPYEGREFGLGQFINEMPTSRKSDWEDYLEYVQRLGDMEAGYHKQKLTYDEWQRMMRRRR
jgi:hypothetical protein